MQPLWPSPCLQVAEVLPAEGDLACHCVGVGTGSFWLLIHNGGRRWEDPAWLIQELLWTPHSLLPEVGALQSANCGPHLFSNFSQLSHNVPLAQPPLPPAAASLSSPWGFCLAPAGSGIASSLPTGVGIGFSVPEGCRLEVAEAPLCLPGSSVSLELPNSLAAKPEPPPAQLKPAIFRAPSRDATTFFPPKSGSSDKAPVNGAEPSHKAPTYNRFTAKPYTSSARPFERKFESPKFNHNLLPSEPAPKPDLSPKAPSSAQPADFDSGVETFSLHADKPKYQLNSVSAVPRAMPVR